MIRDKRIQILRATAMLMIVTCHLVMQYNSRLLEASGQFFNVGVYIFLLISGVLYGNKRIDKFPKWFFSKMLKLLIPIYLFVPIIFILNYILLNSFSLEKVFIYLFNLQGIFGGIQGAGHLWFLTTIMFCYLTIPFLYTVQKNKRKFVKPVFISLLLITAIMFSFINEYVGQQAFYILIFAIGYLYGARFKKVSLNSAILVFVVLLMFGIRLASHKFFDDTILYTIIIVSLTHIIISLCFFGLVFRIRTIKLGGKILDKLDSMSYYVYIVHYVFMVGPVSLMHLTSMSVINTIATLVVSYIAAKGLQVSSGFIYTLMARGFRVWKK